MRVAIRKSDRKILEAQSNDEASMDALRENVINVRGYAEASVEFVILSEDDVNERIKSQNDSRKTYSEKRSAEYDKRGVTIEAMTVALFEKDAIEIARLEAIRQQVKTDIPKTLRK